MIQIFCTRVTKYFSWPRNFVERVRAARDILPRQFLIDRAACDLLPRHFIIDQKIPGLFLCTNYHS